MLAGSPFLSSLCLAKLIASLPLASYSSLSAAFQFEYANFQKHPKILHSSSYGVDIPMVWFTWTPGGGVSHELPFHADGFTQQHMSYIEETTNDPVSFFILQ